MTGARSSAGLLLFRRRGDIEVLIGHMGGPWWAHREEAAWSIPKGEYGPEEDALNAARREFREELGLDPPDSAPLDLGEVRQAGGKRVTVWAIEGELDLDAVEFGTFDMEWPKGSGEIRSFTELDRIAWLPLHLAQEKLVTAQREFLLRLRARLTER